MSSVIKRIRTRIQNKNYRLSAHAEIEMVDDDLEREDIEWCCVNGKVTKRYTDDIRGTRYRVTGSSLDGREINIICKFSSGELFIITVWETEEENHD